MKYTLQEEVRQLYESDRQAHAPSALREAQEIAHSTATYKGVPIKFGYLPKAFTQEGYVWLKAEIEHCWQILIRIIREYLEHEEYRALFGFPQEMEEWILHRPPYQTLLPICRLDLFLNEETGEYKFCEFNTDGSSAMNENRELNRVYKETLIYKQLSAKYSQHLFELFDSWAATFLQICAETGRLPARPHVAVVDFLEKGSSMAEFEQFRDAFVRAGCQACVAEIRDLQYDGEHLYTAGGEIIEAVYRRAVTSDVYSHREEVRPFLQAVRDEKVVLIGDFCTQVVHDKILFKVLHEPQTAQFLSEEDRDYIRSHIPYTAVLTPALAQSARIREDKDHWILKPEDSYGAHGIFCGEQLSQKNWEDVLDRLQRTGYILQEYVKPYRTANIDFSAASPRMESYSNMTGLFLYGGKLAGIYSRSSVTGVISVEGDEHEMVSVVAER